MTHVAVLGAGVVGVTTAWYLQQAGYQVSLIDQEPIVANQTSFANGGQISVCHATPWASIDSLKKMVGWLFCKDAPLLYHPSLNWRMLNWSWQFLHECGAQKEAKNLQQMVALGLYSRKCLKQLRADFAKNNLFFDYFDKQLGIMHVYTNTKEYQNAQKSVKLMQSLGCVRKNLTPDDAKALEPALNNAPMVGATFTPDDESGNAHVFSNLLAQYAKQNGVQLLLNHTITDINTNGAHINHLILQHRQKSFSFVADHYVLALGPTAVFLTDRIGIKLPIFPVKGYSASFSIDSKHAHRLPKISLIDDEYKLVMSRFQSQDKDGKVDILRVAGTAEIGGRAGGYSTHLDYARCEALVRRTKALFGDVVDKVDFWAGLRPMTPQGTPLIGRAHLGRIIVGQKAKKDATFDNFWLNIGHGTLGFTHACGSAKLLTELMSGAPNPTNFQFTGV